MVTVRCWQATFAALLVVVAFQVLSTDGAGFEACPDTCACLGNTVDCSKRRLTNIPVNLPSWTEVLDISLNGIANLDAEPLTGLSNLLEIDINNNRLISVDAQALKYLSRLQILKASHNEISRIPNISSCPSVSQLILSHNVIEQIDLDSLQDASGLQVLDLAYNTISALHNATLPSLPSLQQLLLNNNRIVTIDRGAFDNLTSLESLKLSKNKLHSLAPAIFTRLTKLAYLDLNGNRLKRVEGLRFQGLASLTSLRLKRNSLTELMDGAFWGLPQIQNIHLDYNNLTRIHGGFLFGLETLEHLSLSNNRISVVEADSWTACRRLSFLDLSFNRLSAVTETTFAKLDSLTHLRLGHNRISYITEHAFRDLSSLKILDLDYNEISGVLDDSSGTFVGLLSLTQLNLGSNQIKSVGRHAFDGLTSLKQLDLANNDVTSIQDNAFASLKNLENINLNSSSLLCDCHLSWLPTWLLSTSFHADFAAGCGHPVAARGRSVMDVSVQDFKCDDFPKPVITRHPSSQIALKDGSLNLTCQAVTSSDSPLTIEWKKDHLVLSGDLAERSARFQSKEEGGLYELTSTLRLWPVKADHAGVYQCIVSNALGTVSSSRASVTISVFPRLVKTPSDLTVRAGTTARLECAATGQPTPEVAWQKDGGYDFPAARERRMHVMPSDDVFFIVDVKMDDQGVYTCTAKNDAGVVRTNATLTVIQTPSFVKTTREKVTREGDTVVFECLSSSPPHVTTPRTRVEWLKDGRPLPSASPRHHLVAESQLLIVMRAQPTDAGVYTCIASNALGNERAVSRLTVIPVDKVTEPTSDGDAASGVSEVADDATIRIGLVVIAGVAGIVVTSLFWVVAIYCLQRRRDVSDGTSSTSTDETMIAGSSNIDTLRYCSVTTKDGHSLLGGYRVSPISWRFVDKDQCSGERLVLPSGECKDSGFFCDEARQHRRCSGSDRCSDADNGCCCSRERQLIDPSVAADHTMQSCDSLSLPSVETPTSDRRCSTDADGNLPQRHGDDDTGNSADDVALENCAEPRVRAHRDSPTRSRQFTPPDVSVREHCSGADGGGDVEDDGGVTLQSSNLVEHCNAAGQKHKSLPPET